MIYLTEHQQKILVKTLHDALKTIKEGQSGQGDGSGEVSRGMQDGMLAHYLSAAPFAASNAERRIEKEPFDFRDLMQNPPAKRR